MTIHRALSLHRDRICSCLAEQQEQGANEQCDPRRLRSLLEKMGPPPFLSPEKPAPEPEVPAPLVASVRKTRHMSGRVSLLLFGFVDGADFVFSFCFVVEQRLLTRHESNVFCGARGRFLFGSVSAVERVCGYGSDDAELVCMRPFAVSKLGVLVIANGLEPFP